MKKKKNSCQKYVALLMLNIQGDQKIKKVKN